MFQKALAKNISFPLQDRINGTHIVSCHKFLLESQKWSGDKLDAYQFDKFHKLLTHSFKNVPFYNKLYKDAGLEPGDIKSLDDIKKTPIVSKEMAREFNEQMIATNIDSQNVIKGVTGGTTGPPLKLLRDQQDQTFVWAAFYRWYNWMGIDLGDRTTKVWGTPTVLSYPLKKRMKDKAKNFYYNRQLINSFNLNEKTIPALLNKIEKFKPKLIRGYLSALIQLAEYMQENDIQLSHSPLAISSTTETLIPAFKTLIEKTFNSKLYDQYGCGECNSIAFDAGDGNGLYIVKEHAHIDILDENGNDSPKEDGRIIMTNLDNYAMPFIRYENGDWGCYGEKNNETDINLPVLKRIAGRSADTIVLKDNSKVHGVFFTDILNELFNENPEHIHRFQVCQNIRGKITFRVESGKELESEYAEKLYNALIRFFNKVEIKQMSELPRDKSGKFRYVVSEIKE